MNLEEQKQEKISKNNIRKEIKGAASWLVVALTASLLLFVGIVTNTSGKNACSLFGHKIFIAQTNSMAATDFRAGDLIVSKLVVDTSAITEGDIITFVSQDKLHYGKTVTHKIRKINKTEQGGREFVTYGTTTNVDDETPVAERSVIGEYRFRIPKLGAALAFVKTVPGYISCILAPLLIVIGWNGVDCWKLYKEYKKGKDEKKEIF